MHFREHPQHEFFLLDKSFLVLAKRFQTSHKDQTDDLIFEIEFSYQNLVQASIEIQKVNKRINKDYLRKYCDILQSNCHLNSIGIFFLLTIPRGVFRSLLNI